MSVWVDGIDWSDMDREDRIEVQAVSPTNPNQSYGAVSGVELASSSLTYAYYSDTRVSGKITVLGEGWPRGSMVRIVHSVPGTSYRRELATLYVTDDGSERSKGQWEYGLTLHSALYALSTDLGAYPWTVGKGSKSLAVMRQMLRTCRRPYVEASPTDHRYSSTFVMESGKSFLSRLYQLANDANDRLSVDGHGRVTISPYVPPARRSARFMLDLSDPNGICHDDLSLTTDWLRMAGRAALHYKGQRKVPDGKYKSGKDKGKTKYKSVDVELWAQADAASGHASSGVRGYMVTDYHDVSDMSPQTQARANQLARQYLKTDSREDVEWQLTTEYFPCREGDVGWLVVPEGRYAGRRHVMVKSCDVSLRPMRCRLTLKETGGNDEERGQ